MEAVQQGGKFFILANTNCLNLMVMNVEKDFQKMCCINCMVPCLVYYCDAFPSQKTKENPRNARNSTVVNDNNKFSRLHFPILVVTSRKVHVKKKIRVIFSFIWLKNRDKIYLNSRCLPMHEYHQEVTMINICIFYFKIFECVQMVLNQSEQI